jgi:hypothetical protein
MRATARNRAWTVMVPLIIVMVINFADKADVSRSGPARGPATPVALPSNKWFPNKLRSRSTASLCKGGGRRHGGTAAAQLGHSPLDLTLGLRLTQLGRPHLVCIVARLLRPRRVVGHRERKGEGCGAIIPEGRLCPIAAESLMPPLIPDR